MKNAFTLIELLVAIFLLTLGIGGTYSLISNFIVSSSISSQRLIAAYLAQEGIEIVRNIRDTNLLEGENWRNGLENGNWQGDYTINENLMPCADPCDYNNLSFLRIDANGFYGYGAGNHTIFKRRITLGGSGDVMEVRVTVFWQERGRSYQFTVQENLYNWR